MKFGLMNLFPFPEGKAAEVIFRETLDEVAYAEELSFDSVWLGEHHFSPYGILGNPLVLAAAIAERTHRMRIGTAVLVLPFYDPIRAAEDCALVDVLSGGRLDVGFGRGYQPREFEGFRIPQEEARERAAECVDIMKLAWTKDRFSYDGTHFTVDDIEVYPKPVQLPHPPLWRAAVSLSSFEQAGRAGEPILTSPNFTPLDVVKSQFATYRSALEEGGHDPSSFDLPLMQQVYVGLNSNEARETPEQHAMWFYEMLHGLVPGGPGETPKGYEEWAKFRQGIGDITYETVFNQGANFGTVDEVIDKLRELRDDVGVTQYIGWFNFGGLPHDKVMASLERFAKDVMPALR